MYFLLILTPVWYLIGIKNITNYLTCKIVHCIYKIFPYHWFSFLHSQALQLTIMIPNYNLKTGSYRYQIEDAIYNVILISISHCFFHNFKKLFHVLFVLFNLDPSDILTLLIYLPSFHFLSLSSLTLCGLPGTWAGRSRMDLLDVTPT